MKLIKEFFHKKSTLTDFFFISIIVIASSILYASNIGFYSDDWGILASFSISPDQSLVGLIKAATNSNTFMRPMQNILHAVLFILFGLNPTGYQLASIIFLIANALLFYTLLRKLSVSRLLCVAIPILFILLPNYSSDRFWFAAFAANLSLMFYFISSLSAINVIYSQKLSAVLWGIVSILCLLVSALAYEVILPMYFLNILVVGYLALRKKNRIGSITLLKVKEILLIILTILAIISVFIFKAKVTTRLESGPLEQPLLYPIYLVYVVVFSFWTNFIQLTLNFITSWKNLHLNDFTSAVFLSGVLIGIGIFIYLYYCFTEYKSDLPTTNIFKKITFLGLAVFFLGYFIFFLNSNVGFSSTGMDNRVAIAASIGVAVSIIGVVGWIGRIFFKDKVFRIYFSVITAIICMSGFLVIHTVAADWTEAYSQEKVILSKIKNKFPTLPSGSAFILDGICPYVGPAVVFTSRWDLKGAMQLLYHDNTLTADTVTPKMKLMEEGILTKYYHFVTKYTYKKLIIYNYKSNNTYQIRSFADANGYFQNKNYDFGNGCPASKSDPPNNSKLIKSYLLLVKSIYYDIYMREQPKLEDYFSQKVYKWL